jgi:stage II sporulation protein E
MELPENEYVVKRQNGVLKTFLTLIEKRRYGIAYATAQRTKSKSRESGDSHSFIMPGHGSGIMGLSDGMGSGAQAKRESSSLLGMFEDYVTAGWSADAAIKLINSSLLLKTGSESFATLDICRIDLYTGSAEFIKLGAPPSFIITKTGVEPLRSRSLPIGSTLEAEAETARMRLSNGDVVVMVTDGVTDSADDDGWLTAELNSINNNLIERVNKNNPQEIADYLLTAAEKNYGGVVADDMLVMVGRIWEK